MKDKTLKDVLPNELMYEYNDTKAYEMRNIKVVAEYGSGHDLVLRAWVGTHKNVYYWVVLENGYAVAWNENPAKGWSFPVVKMKETK